MKNSATLWIKVDPGLVAEVLGIESNSASREDPVGFCQYFFEKNDFEKTAIDELVEFLIQHPRLEQLLDEYDAGVNWTFFGSELDLALGLFVGNSAMDVLSRMGLDLHVTGKLVRE